MGTAAWVGAGVSLLAALVALAAAVFARRSAWEVASLNHRIAALDREAEQFREDLRAVFLAGGAIRAKEDVLPLRAAVSIIQANPRTTPGVSKAAMEFSQGLASAFDPKRLELREQPTGPPLQGAARDVLAVINDERAALVSERDRLRWLPWRRRA